ncbi:ELC1 (YPL046C) [Zygosaccharomyces parabailii]|uniref:Elongin-C n=1 Tax=Zygosaccharomyces bailii (strain CLIB 213 / ATCC 58445 / CBS 680 / BCRC 21525 / NBRC 1098 / NCYC 1416 / NRRL Y-2227) TaxID=1333698 RepID=A0A8J2T8P0_ZYGB2|nr:ELC1 (YPL046C) [Zygosaccharomyces parabailii]CDF91096.1 ZYBA0S09-04698g1_1 [Zygosaccharomyces bailii CLIB 213]SJM86279.1 probable Elongin-C [Zygosaccharomyces bailii]
MPEVTLISSDKREFSISREAAMVSPTLKAMLEGPFKEKNGRVELPGIEGNVLAKTVEYLQYNLRYRAQPNQEDIPEFEIPTEMALELLLAADYLNV